LAYGVLFSDLMKKRQLNGRYKLTLSKEKLRDLGDVATEHLARVAGGGQGGPAPAVSTGSL
jgi:hypothetical protein